MSKDISSILNNWQGEAKTVNARMIEAKDGQRLIQLRIDCGVLQMYLDGRPDGTNPHGCETLLEYARDRVEGLFGELDDEEGLECEDELWAELDREMGQFYHRRLALLAVARQAQDTGKTELAGEAYCRAAQDADYTLAALDFITEFCIDEDYVDQHERFRPFVLWHKTIALAQQRVLDRDFDDAVEQIKQGKGQIARVYEDHGMTKWLKHDPSIAELKNMEKDIRKRYGVKATLKEQLETALGREDYENAARIRDKLKAKGQFFDRHRPRVTDRPAF